MNIEMIHEPQGFDQALRAMRNPMNSWKKNDSYFEDDSMQAYHVGDNDIELSIKLQKAGPEHCKHLRMIYVWANITAPRYW